MILTGERVIPNLMKPENGMLREHTARYRFASKFACGSVLDIACGVGYGTGLLLNESTVVENVLGVDIDEISINYAKIHYSHPKAKYLVKDALSPYLHDEIGLFDTVISFETIEHLKEDAKFVRNLQGLLKPDGALIISTPLGRGRGIACSDPFHVHQYKEEEFIDLLNCFGSVDMYYQFGETIEKMVKGKKYYLMVAVCRH
ncbi:MAG: class I SAM-dependent methyltransferase [Oscillospiraceae bacterium]